MINTTAVLSVSNLRAIYDTTPVLDGVTFAVQRGSLVGIVGPNGAGKSTLLKTIVGLLPTSQGVVTFFGNSFEQERKRVAYVPQKSSVDLDFPVTVFDVAQMGSYVHLGWFKRPGKKERDATWTALSCVGMTDYADRPLGSLSGGQQQRVFLARALVQNPDLYIMDEPFAAVDMVTEKLMIKLLKMLCAEGKTVIIVHHDLQSLERYFDYLIILNRRVVASGLVKDVLADHALDRAYGQKMTNGSSCISL